MTITFADGTSKVVRVRPVTQVAFEREHNCAITTVGERADHSYWLAWHADTRGNVPYDAWLENVDDITPEVVEADPTSPALPAS